MNNYLCLVALIAVTTAFPTTPKAEETIKIESELPTDVNIRQGYNNYPVQQGGYPATGGYPGNQPVQQGDYLIQGGILPGGLPPQQQGYPVQAGILPGSLPISGNYPAVHPGNFPAQVAYPQGSLNAPVAALPGQLSVGDVPPHPLNSRPSYAYDSAYPDEVNFALADPHRNVAAAIQTSVQSALGGATELLQTGYQGKPAVSASAAVVKGPSSAF